MSGATPRQQWLETIEKVTSEGFTEIMVQGGFEWKMEEKERKATVQRGCRGALVTAFAVLCWVSTSLAGK